MAEPDTSHPVWLTQEAYDRLALELEQLTTKGRAEISKRIEVAREEGDLKENGGYHAAKDEQAKMENRIRTLTSMLKHAVVGEVPESTGVVESGTVVSAHIHGDVEKFLLGSRELGGDTELDVYSAQSPLGAAIMGLRVGESSTYTAPSGAEIAVEIIAVETFIP
jgi:transcription elongation factor GreA